MKTMILILFGFFLAAPLHVAAQDDSPPGFLLKSVRVFDGESTIDSSDVLVIDGMIAKMGQGIEPSDDVELIDGTGMTLLPGLIDCHVHAYFAGQLKQAAEFGVTTVCDMMSMPYGAAGMRSAQEKDGAPNRADYLSAGAAVTVEGGHGTQFGFKVPVLENAEGAEKFIEDRFREGSDYIKIIHEPGTAYGLVRPTLSDEMLKASIAATNDREKLAVAHIGTMEGAELVVEHGIAGLVHLFADQKISDELLAAMKEKQIFVVPTTVVIQNITGPATVDSLIKDEYIGPLLSPNDVTSLQTTFPKSDEATNTTENLYYNIAALEKAGIAVVAGTDAPNPGTTFGASIHHELELLTLAGLTNEQALAAATSRAADAFKLEDRGRIQVGFRADLVLVEGNPVEDIKATRNIQRVWKTGHAIDLESRPESIKKAWDKKKERENKDGSRKR